MENKGKLILTEIFPSVQKHDIKIIETLWRPRKRLYENVTIHKYIRVGDYFYCIVVDQHDTYII